MFKKLSTIAILSLAASSASAETLRCNTGHVSKTGFTNLAAARSWFPEDFSINISGEQAVSDFYGRGIVKNKGSRVYIDFVLASSKDVKTIVKLTFIPKSGKFVGRLKSDGYFQQTPGASGSCTVS